MNVFDVSITLTQQDRLQDSLVQNLLSTYYLNTLTMKFSSFVRRCIENYYCRVINYYPSFRCDRGCTIKDVRLQNRWNSMETCVADR